MIFFLASCLIFAGTVSGQCADESQKTMCIITFAQSSQDHKSDAKLVCGDLTNFESCIRNISCLTATQKNDEISKMRTSVANQGITCLAGISCPSCVTKFIEQIQLHKSNDPLLCSDYKTMESCLAAATDCPSEQKQAFLTQNALLINVKACVETTPAVTTTTPKPNDCTNPIDQCIITFSMMSTQHGPNPELVCGDLSTFQKCILDSTCVTSNAEKDAIITQTKSQLQAKGVTCDMTTTKTPLTTTTSVKACTNPIDLCIITFSMMSTQHGPNRDLVCGDLSTFEKCILDSTCVTSNAEKDAIITQTKSQLQAKGVTCEITSTTKMPPTTTMSVKECSNPIDQCIIMFSMMSTQHGPNPDLVCGDLSTFEKCILDSTCVTSNAEKDAIITQTRSQLQARGVTCGTTTKIPSTTSSLKECTNPIDQCVITFSMMSTQHGPNPELVCGDLSTFEKCILDSTCVTSNAEKDAIITQTKSQLQAKGVTCGPSTTKTTLTTTSAAKVCTTTMDQCVVTFAMISTQRGPNAELICGDLSVMEKCIFDSNCGNSAAEKETIISQTKSQLTTRGINCGLPTTTKSPVTMLIPVKGCTTTVDQCVINFAIVSTTYGSNADPVCRELSTMEKCVLDTNCGTSSSDKEILIAQTRNQLKSRGISCDGVITTTAIPVTTTKTACRTLVDNCVVSFVVASSAHTTDADLTCRDFSTMEKCIAAVCDSPDAEKSAVRNQIKTELQQKYNISCVYGATYPTTKSPVTSPTTVKFVTTAIPTNTKTTDRDCLDTVDNCVFNFMIISTSHGPNPTLVCGDLLVMETCIMETNCGMPDTEKRSVIDQNTNKLAARGVMCGTTTTKIPVQTTEKSCSPDQCMNTFLQSLSDHNGMQELMCGDLSILENCLNIKCGLSEVQKNSFITQSTQLLELQGVKCDCSSKVLTCQNRFIENYAASNSNQDLICSHQRTLEKCIQAIDCVSASNKTLLIERNKQNMESKGIMCDCVNGYSQCEESYQIAAFSKPITRPLLCTHIQTFMKCIFDLSSCDRPDAFKDKLFKETKEALDIRGVPCDIYKVIYGTDEPGSDGSNSGPKLILQTPLYLLASVIVIIFKL